MSFELPKLRWIASPNFSERSAKVDLIVIHDCQGGYEGSIRTFQGDNGGHPVSAHIVLKEDGSEATQMVAWDKKAWHAVAFNSRSIGLEMAGFKEKGFSDSEWSAEATMTAYLCRVFGIPVRWAEHGQGPGITRHLDLGKAGGGHSDPTDDMNVWSAFIGKVRDAYEAMGEHPEPWGRGVPGGQPAPAPAPARVHQLTKAVSTSWVQATLNRVLPEDPPLSVDNVFGPKTKARLAAFLREEGLDPFADFLTLEAVAGLRRAFAALL